MLQIEVCLENTWFANSYFVYSIVFIDRWIRAVKSEELAHKWQTTIQIRKVMSNIYFKTRLKQPVFNEKFIPKKECSG